MKADEFDWGAKPVLDRIRARIAQGKVSCTAVVACVCDTTTKGERYKRAILGAADSQRVVLGLRHLKRGVLGKEYSRAARRTQGSNRRRKRQHEKVPRHGVGQRSETNVSLVKNPCEIETRLFLEQLAAADSQGLLMFVGWVAVFGSGTVEVEFAGYSDKQELLRQIDVMIEDVKSGRSERGEASDAIAPKVAH